MNDFTTLAVAADQFDMTEDELIRLVRDGMVVGVLRPQYEDDVSGWLVDRASLAEFRRGDSGADQA